MTAKYQRVYAQIDLDAIHNNMEQMHRNLPPGTKMIGVVKTDAYGHGAVQIGRELESLDSAARRITEADSCPWICVS